MRHELSALLGELRTMLVDLKPEPIRTGGLQSTHCSPPNRRQRKRGQVAVIKTDLLRRFSFVASSEVALRRLRS